MRVPIFDQPAKASRGQRGLRLFVGLSLVAFFWLPFSPAAIAQQDSGAVAAPPRGTDAAEMNAYTAAANQTNPQMRILALRAFLNQYPNSNFRQPAMAQLMSALRESRGMPAAAAAAGVDPIPQPARPSQPAAQPSAAVSAPAPVYSGVRESLLTQPAKQPEVHFSGEGLAIKADNSSLSQILNQVAQQTGMKVEGLSKDERIFGSYGPGKPREVLSALLDGSGYNILMVGDGHEGAPLELSLSPQQKAQNSASPAPQQPNSESADDDADDEVQQVPEPPVQPVGPPQPGTGAPSDGSQQPRTPQQIIQELQRMRQQQNQQ